MLTAGLISDDAVLANGLSHVLQSDCSYTFQFFDASPGATLVSRVVAAAPNILLLDLEAGVSLTTVEELRRLLPACRLCLWGRSIPDELAYQTMTLGVKGILRRNISVNDLLACLRNLAQGSVWFEERLMAGFFSSRVIRLTRRESQLVNLLAQGLKNKEIAWRLSLSEGTVKVYLSRLFEKLGVKDRFELALYGLRNLSIRESDSMSANRDPAPLTIHPLGAADIRGTRA